MSNNNSILDEINGERNGERNSKGRFKKGWKGGPGRPRKDAKENKKTNHRDSDELDILGNIKEAERVGHELTKSQDPVARAQGARILISCEKLRSKEPEKDTPVLSPLAERIVADYVQRNIMEKPEGGPSITGEEDST